MKTFVTHSANLASIVAAGILVAKKEKVDFKDQTNRWAWMVFLLLLIPNLVVFWAWNVPVMG